MNKSKIFMAVLATAGMGWMPAAMATPVIGFDPCGASGLGACGDFAYATIWSDRSDSGVDIGSTTALGVHTFHTQTVVSALTNTNTVGDTTPLGLNVVNPASQALLNGIGVPTFEISKTLVLTDFLFAITGGGGAPVTFNFSSFPGAPSSLSIFFDALSAAKGDASQAVPQGPNGAKCYGPNGTAVTTGAAVGCGLDSNAFGGVVNMPPILTMHVVSSISSFTASSPGHGTGSFDITLAIDSFNPAYISLSNPVSAGGNGTRIIGERLKGTLSQPFSSFTTPGQMWDGTTPGGNQLFEVISDETFIVPEPGSLFLLGLGLAGLGAISRRRSA